MKATQTRKGFTLIEILIVVIILGILAAIVIPQFTNASKEAKQSSLVTMVQSLRSQIALYKLQHNDFLPGGVVAAGVPGAFSSGTFWNQMTLFSDINGNTNATKTAVFDKGPYMQSRAVNPLTTGSLVVDGMGNTPTADFVYDYTGGVGPSNGSGKFWGTTENVNGTIITQ